MADVAVKLSKPYINPFDGTRFDSVTLREPTFEDVYSSGRGAPTEWQRSSSGVMVLLTRHEIVAEYIDILAVTPDVGALKTISGIDALMLGRAVIDFFIEDEMPASAPTSSSSSVE